MRSLWLLCLVLAGCSTSPDSYTSSPPRPTFDPGQRVTLHNDDGSPILIFWTKQANLDALAANRNKDAKGAEEIIASRTFPVANGTPAQVIEYDGWNRVANVRLLSGPHSGESGWVPEPQLR